MSQNETAHARRRLGLEAGDPAQVAALRAWMRQLPDVDVSLEAGGAPKPGELGVADVVSVVAGSTGLLAAIRTLPDFLRSRRSGISIETTVRGERFTLTATNVEDVLPLLERLLDE